MEGPDPLHGRKFRAVAVEWLLAASIVWWAASWNLRNSILMSWVPVEPIVVGGVALVVCGAYRLARPLSISPVVAGSLTLLLVAFVPGVLLSADGGYGASKVDGVLLAIAPAMIVAVLVLNSESAHIRWVTAQTALGLAVAVATLANRDPGATLAGARLTLDTVDTISAGRFVGAAVIPLVLAGIYCRRARWLSWVLATGCLLILVQIGSRGPLLAVVVAFFAVLVVGKFCGGGRLRAAIVGTGAVAGVYTYASADGGAGGQRLVDTIQGSAEASRQPLIADALAISADRPWGIGWGSFAELSPAGRAIANTDGVSYPHNLIVECLVEGGVIAAVAVLGVLGLAFFRSWRSSGSLAGALTLAALTYWVVNAQFSFDIVGNRLMWVTVVGALACGARATTSRRAPATPACGLRRSSAA